MVLFWPIQQELDCVSTSGHILGKIKFDGNRDEYVFSPDNESIVLSEREKLKIVEKLACLESGNHSIPMQDDD